MVKLFFNGEEKGFVKDDSIKFYGLDLNEYLDEVLGNIVEEELEDGNVAFVGKVAPLEQKLIHLVEVMGFDIKEDDDKKKEKKSVSGDLGSELVGLLEDKEREIKNYLEQEIGTDLLKDIKSEIKDYSEEDIENIEIKSINDLVKAIHRFLNIDNLKDIVYKSIKTEFLKGSEESEEEINKYKPFNYIPDHDAINYISEYTFENIKGMNEDLANGLRTQLQIGFMNGEGINKLKERVKSVFDTNSHRAEAIARTESSRASMFGKYNAWQQSGLKAKKWILMTDDHRTSEISKALNKKYGSPEKAIPLEENFKAVAKVGKKTITIDQPVGPFHINERCDLMIIPEI